MNRTIWYWLGCSTAMANSTALMTLSALYGSGLEAAIGISFGASGAVVTCWLLLRPASIRWLRAKPPIAAKSSQSQPTAQSLQHLLSRFPLF